MQLPAEAVTATALIEVVRISALPTRRDVPYPGTAVAHWAGSEADAALTLIARHWEKQQAWQDLLVPEVARWPGGDPVAADDPRARALVASTLACLDAATDAWTACNGAIPVAVLIDRAMDALTAHASSA
jgi:hypothetical protein